MRPVLSTVTEKVTSFPEAALFSIIDEGETTRSAATNMKNTICSIVTRDNIFDRCSNRNSPIHNIYRIVCENPGFLIHGHVIKARGVKIC